MYCRWLSFACWLAQGGFEVAPESVVATVGEALDGTFPWLARGGFEVAPESVVATVEEALDGAFCLTDRFAVCFVEPVAPDNVLSTEEGALGRVCPTG